MKKIAPFVLLVVLAITACASLPIIIAASVEAAAEALQWIDRIDQHMAVVDAVDPAVARRARDASSKARAVAECVQSRGHDCGDLERELRALLSAAAPLGVRELPPGLPPGLLGAQPDGTLAVPPACEIVRGAEACGASSAPGGGAL
jgi:hypothetical protein